MKKSLLILILFFTNGIHAQEKMATTNGIITFEASVPFFEAVEAKNEAVDCVLNTKKGLITFVVTVKEFGFKRSLMEEHFNKNYLETDRYPKATFKGLIEKFDLKNLNEKMTEYQIKGRIVIHGKAKNIIVFCKLKKTTEGIELNSDFTLNTDDYNIEIPYIIRSKVSKNVNLNFKSVLQ